MYMVKKLDAGNIISQKAINIEDNDDVGTMHDKLSVLGANLLKRYLPCKCKLMIVFHKMTHKQHSLQILAEKTNELIGL